MELGEVKIIKLLYGGIYLIFSALIILRGTLDIVGTDLSQALYFVSSDIGYGIVVLSIGVISISYINSEDIIKQASGLFVSTVLSLGLLGIRILVILSHYLDYLLTQSVEGEGLFDLTSELSYVEIYTSIITIVLLYYAYRILRRYTI